MLLLVILIIQLGVIGVLNVAQCEKLCRIEVMLDTFSKRLCFIPNDDKKCGE